MYLENEERGILAQSPFTAIYRLNKNATNNFHAPTEHTQQLTLRKLGFYHNGLY